MPDLKKLIKKFEKAETMKEMTELLVELEQNHPDTFREIYIAVKTKLHQVENDPPGLLRNRRQGDQSNTN